MWPILGEISLTLGDWICSLVPAVSVGTICSHHQQKTDGSIPRARKKGACLFLYYSSFPAVLQHASMWVWSVHREKMTSAVLHLSWKLLKLHTALTASKNQCTTCIINGFFPCTFTVEVLSHIKNYTLVQSVLLQCHDNFPVHQNIIIKPNDLIILAI